MSKYDLEPADFMAIDNRNSPVLGSMRRKRPGEAGDRGTDYRAQPISDKHLCASLGYGHQERYLCRAIWSSQI
jgi:hypothetical protein